MRIKTAKAVAALATATTLVAAMISGGVAAHAETTTATETVTATEGTLTWGYKESWRKHMPSNIFGVGETITKYGVREKTKGGVFEWEELAEEDGVPVNPSAANTFMFAGELAFKKYFVNNKYLVDTTFTKLRLRIDADKQKGALIADVAYRKGATMEHALSANGSPESINVPAKITENNLEFATVDLSGKQIDYNAEKIDVKNAPVTFTKDPVGGGIYLTKDNGAADPLSFTLKLKQSKAAKPAAPATPAPSQPQVTAPAKAPVSDDLVIFSVGAEDTTIKGTAKPTKANAKKWERNYVSVKAKDDERWEYLGKADVSESGEWTFEVPENKRSFISKDRVLEGQQSFDYDKKARKVQVTVGAKGTGGVAPAVTNNESAAPAVPPAAEKNEKPAENIKNDGKFSVAPITDVDKHILGTGKPQARIAVMANKDANKLDGWTFIGSATVGEDGTWKVSVSGNVLEKNNVVMVTETPKGTATFTNNKVFNITKTKEYVEPEDKPEAKKKELPKFADNGKMSVLESGELIWGYVDSWNEHVMSNIGPAPGEINVKDGAEKKNGSFAYKMVPVVANKKFVTVIPFNGSVQWKKYGRLVDTTVTNVRLRVDSPISGAVIADVTYRKGANMAEAKLVDFQTDYNLVIATVDFSKQPIDFTKDEIKVVKAPTTVTPEGADIVGGRYIYTNNPGSPVSFTAKLKQQDIDTASTVRTTVVTGEEITVSTKATAGKKVTFKIFSEPVVLGTVVANAEGVAMLKAKIPADLAEGLHHIKAFEEGKSDPIMVKPVDVVKSAKPEPAPGQPNPEPEPAPGQLDPKPEPVQPDGKTGANKQQEGKKVLSNTGANFNALPLMFALLTAGVAVSGVAAYRKTVR